MRGVLNISVFLIILFLISSTGAIRPTGGIISEISSTRAQADTPQQVQALAGNLTELNIIGYSTTQTWQGYFGNVSGTIQLADSGDNVLYNWTLAHPQGEIYAAETDSIDWSSIMCFNFTADNSRAAESNNAGNTSIYGMNLAALETAYGITSDDVDGVDETFSLTDGSGYTHSAFYTNSLKFEAGECLSVHLRGDNGVVADANFEEVLLYDSENEQPVFASLLDEESVAGFDGADRDFEMLVLEDGHGTDTSTTAYFFYVELQ